MENAYTKNGYANRKDYLESLAAEFNLPIEVVLSGAQMMGPDEDFDGLINMLEDAESMF